MNSITRSNWINRIVTASAILTVALIFAGTAKARRATVTRQECISNLRYWGQSFALYTTDYEDRFPTFANDVQAEALVKPYHDDNFDARPMRSPINGSLYHVNPDASGAFYSSRPMPSDTTPLLIESVPSVSKTPLVVALNLRVYQNGFFADDSPQVAVDNAHALITGLQQYIQDYDETLPYKMDSASLKVLLFPYLKTLIPFTYSPKGGEFIFDSTLAGRVIASFDDPSAVIVLKTPNSLIPITGRLSGKVYVGDKPYLTPPAPTPYGELIQARSLATGVLSYSQDYDEMLPDTTNYTNFKEQLYPYLRDPYAFQTVTGKDYLLNAAISGAGLGLFPDVSTVELFRSPELLYNGKRVIAYLNGRARYVKE